MDKINKLVVFDLDGTINRSDLSSLPTIQDIQKKLGLKPYSIEHIKTLYGLPTADFFKALFPENTQNMVKKYFEHVPSSIRRFAHLSKSYDGIPQLLDKLKLNGYSLAICSNADQRYINFMLKSLDLSNKIDYVQELPDNINSKVESLAILLNKLKPSKAIMVGDTEFDREAAEQNNIDFIGCTYGFQPEEMQKVKYKVNSAFELFDLIENLFSI